MNSLQSIKLSQFNINQKSTSSSVARSIAALSNDMSAAIEHQVYVKSNIDENIDESFLAIMSDQVDQLAVQFTIVSNKIADLLAVRNGAMTVAELKDKYIVNIEAYSANLA